MSLFTPKELAAFNLTRALQQAAEGDFGHSLEAEMSGEVARRAGKSPMPNAVHLMPEQLATAMRRDLSVTGTGGFLVGTDVQPWRDVLRPWSVAVNAGAQIADDLTGAITVPQSSTTPGGTWLASELAAVTPAQPTIGQASLSPKNCVAITEIGHQLRQQAVNLDPFIARSLARDLAHSLDAAILAGAGVDGEPLGIMHTAGCYDGSATPFDWDDIQAMLEAVALASAPESSMRWVAHPAVRRELSGRGKLNGTDPAWGGSERSAREMAGYFANVTTACPTDALFMSAWSELLIGFWGGVELVADPMTGFATGKTAFRAWLSADVGLLTPGAFAFATVA